MKKIPPQRQAKTDTERAQIARFFCAQKSSALPRRFWSKVRVDFTTGCWEWRGAVDPNGYGRYQVEGITRYCHRLAYEDSGLPIKDGLYLDHMCWNRACLNPSHIQQVTNSENAQNRSVLNANNTSGVRGVYWCSTFRRWKATGRLMGKRVYIGSFRNKGDAEEAAIEWRLENYPNSLTDRFAGNKKRVTLA